MKKVLLLLSILISLTGCQTSKVDFKDTKNVIEVKILKINDEQPRLKELKLNDILISELDLKVPNKITKKELTELVRKHDFRNSYNFDNDTEISIFYKEIKKKKDYVREEVVIDGKKYFSVNLKDVDKVIFERKTTELLENEVILFEED